MSKFSKERATWDRSVILQTLWILHLEPDSSNKKDFCKVYQKLINCIKVCITHIYPTRQRCETTAFSCLTKVFNVTPGIYCGRLEMPVFLGYKRTSPPPPPCPLQWVTIKWQLWVTLLPAINPATNHVPWPRAVISRWAHQECTRPAQYNSEDRISGQFFFNSQIFCLVYKMHILF